MALKLMFTYTFSMSAVLYLLYSPLLFFFLAFINLHVKANYNSVIAFIFSNIWLTL